jgi:hypothetical protein
MMVMSMAVMVFRDVVIRAIALPAPTALVGNFVEYFPAIIATVH